MLSMVQSYQVFQASLAAFLPAAEGFTLPVLSLHCLPGLQERERAMLRVQSYISTRLHQCSGLGTLAKVLAG